MAEELEQRVREIQREYLDFLDDEGTGDGTYTQLVNDLIKNNEKRLIVNINHLRRHNPKRAQSLIENSPEEILAFERALREFVGSADPTYAKDNEDFFVGFTGSFGNHHVTPRTLSAKHLSHIVCVEGIVTKCSLVRPKVVKSVHYCPTTKKSIERRYADLTSYDAFPTSSVYPTKDEDGNALETEYGLCTYKDHQTLSIQEMPEKSPPGQLPRSVDIVCDNDLVDQCKPGDRVHVIGMYRCLPGKQGGFTTGAFRTVLIANNLSPISKEQAPNISTSDVKKCKKFAHQKLEDKEVFDVLAQSLAPSICGHIFIKKALLCMLLGGVEKHLPNGTRLRGDINVLLIGDPSVAKSQLLRYVLYTAPRAISTTGRGSSGVGLTAAVTTDQETGERRLEAGAMVLADRGVVCIDEFDKMSDQDRTAIHEVMEQGRVTISKAGIHARLNARCSVLAAANPVFGNYNQYKTPMENIGLQDSLLSRFDLLFIMLDTVDAEHDRLIADHVVRMHRYRSPTEQDGEALSNAGLDTDLLTTIREPDDEDKENENAIYEKYDSLLHGSSRSKKDKIVSMNFMKKYIHIAKFIKPTLTKDASDLIAEEYSKLRSQEAVQSHVARTQPITARALETLIRLSTAHAKARLSKTVDVNDAEAAIELVQYAYFKKVVEKNKNKRPAEDDLEGSPDRRVKKSKTKVRRVRKQPGEKGYDPYDWTEDEEEDDPDSLPLSAPSETPMDTSAEVTDDRFKVFKSSLFKIFMDDRAESIGMEKVKKCLNETHASQPFSNEEITASLQRMTDANQVMLADNILFLI